jgi:hypothetical protein
MHKGIIDDHPRPLHCDQLSIHRAFEDIAESAELVSGAWWHFHAVQVERGRKLLTAMSELDNEVDGATPSRMLFWNEVQKLHILDKSPWPRARWTFFTA